MNNNLLKDETLTHKLISKWFWLYLFAFLAMPLWYIIRVVLSNDLWPSEVGIIYWLLSLMGLLSILSSLWVNQESIVYFLPKYYIQKNKDYVTTIYKIVRYLNIFMTIVFAIWIYFFIQYAWNSYIDHPQIETILYIFLWVFVFINLANPLQWIFTSFQNVFVPKLSDFLKQSIITIWIITIFLLWIGSLFTYSLAFLVWNVVLLILLYLSYRKKYYTEVNSWNFIKDNALLKKLISFWLHTLIAANAMMIITNIDMQMLLVISWTEQAWYYTNYMSLTNIIMVFLSPIISLLFPIISELYNKKDTKKLWLLQDFFYKYFIIFAISIALLLTVFGQVIWVVLFWEDFLYSGTLLTYLAVFGIFKVMFAINFGILMWIWQVKKRTKILVSVLILNILLNIILIPSLWALWAWIATWISWVMIALASLYYVNSNLKININWLFYIKNIVILWIIWIIYLQIIPDLFILENDFRYNNLAYLLFMWFGAYVILALFNLWEIKIFMKELRRFRKS